MSERCDHGRADDTMCPWCQQADTATMRRELTERIFQAVRMVTPGIRRYEHPKVRAAIERVLESEGRR